MKKLLMMVGFFIPLITEAQLQDPFTYPVYDGKDLGLTYTSRQSSFRVWAPTAERCQLIIYRNGTGGDALQTIEMIRGESGTWTGTFDGDQRGKFYVFRVLVNGHWLNEVPDPYAKIVGINGKRAMIEDINATNPPGWNHDRAPKLAQATDAIIYELHVRDASIAANSGIKHRGKFSGLAETGTKNTDGLSTGMDHLRELGVTHIHLLPSFDFYSINEEKADSVQYNWGYDPLNYNTPEGSYATNAVDGTVRIREFKQLIKALHDNGMNVVMDVVYNHTMLTEDSYFNQLVPGYYYRQTADGKFSNATACGNETASERPMMRKFMLESMLYWAKEYHIDGFRVDLMGVHDIVTMNLISKELHKINPQILVYGEGWTAGASPVPDSLRALKKFAYKLDHIAVFSDDIRDGIKGSVFDHKDRGFVSGKPGMEESIKFGIVAACRHPQVNYQKVNYSKAPYAKEPYQVITYTECHDNHVLWDKLAISAGDVSEEERKEMHKLALSIVLTSQGISFLHAGTEFLRTKQGHENSFNAGDSINAIDWDLKTKNIDVFNYTRALIEMRKHHPAFRMSSAKAIAANLRFDENLPAGMVAFSIDGAATKDSWKKVKVIFNGSRQNHSMALKGKNWKGFIVNNKLVHSTIANKPFLIGPSSCSILYQE
jgi:pullulanase